MPTYPLTIWTIRSYVENGYTLGRWCPQCRRHLPDADLPELMKQGLADQAGRDLGLRCETCQARVELIVQPPSRHATRPLPE